MIDIRRFNDLGRFDNDWLAARYHFSFSHYFDPNRMGHGKLRVWNDDTIRAGTGFPPHGHESMEIITYVRKGAITHKDSLGNEGRTEAGDVQVMSAGSGVRHSEWNAEAEDTQIFQLWIEPAEQGGAPDWGAKAFPKADRANAWVTLASGDTADDALPIRQDAKVLGATLGTGQSLTYTLTEGRKGYVVLAAGSVKLGETVLSARDGAALTGPDSFTFTGVEDAELVFVDTI
ncbi:MAG: pirin family protein [Pseudomonadota bacterium]